MFLFSSFFVFEIFTFSCYATEESDDVIGGTTKTAQHSIKNISRNIKAVFFKLGTRNVHYKRKKMTPVMPLPRQQLCRWCFFETKIPRFYFKQGSSTPNNLLATVKTIWEPCVFRAKLSVLLSKVANGGIWFFRERDWNQGCCHRNKIVGVVLFLLWRTLLVPSLKTIAWIFWKIFLIQYFVIYVEPFVMSSLSSFA